MKCVKFRPTDHVPFICFFVHLLFHSLVLTPEAHAGGPVRGERVSGRLSCPASGWCTSVLHLPGGRSPAPLAVCVLPCNHIFRAHGVALPRRRILVPTETSTLGAGMPVLPTLPKEFPQSPPPNLPRGLTFVFGVHFPPEFGGSPPAASCHSILSSRQQELIPARWCHIAEARSLSFPFFSFHAAASLISPPPYLLPFDFFMP